MHCYMHLCIGIYMTNSMCICIYKCILYSAIKYVI